jgi:hypothetical protein
MIWYSPNWVNTKTKSLPFSWHILVQCISLIISLQYIIMVRFHKVSYFLQHVHIILQVNTSISLYGIVNKFIQDNLTNTIITPINLHTIAHYHIFHPLHYSLQKIYLKLFYVNKEQNFAH